MKKLNVNENCIGCGYCVSNCPEYFEFSNDGYSKPIKNIIENDDLKYVTDVASGCPVDAIQVTDASEAIEDNGDNEKAA